MKEVLSVDNMRKSDAAAIASGTASAELMYRAGEGIYKLLLTRYGKDIFYHIVAGSGNNAGDGYVAAMLMQRNNIPCRIYLTKDKFSEDGKYYYDAAAAAGVSIVRLSSDNDGTTGSVKGREDSNSSFIYENGNVQKSGGINEPVTGGNEKTSGALSDYVNAGDVILDCILGTGFKGEVREPLRSVIEQINGLTNVHVVSADINSGLNGDNGLYDICVKSELTISIGRVMPGLYLNKAKDVIGETVNIDIGIEAADEPFYLVESEDVRQMIPSRLNDSNKGTYGYIALVGGSYRYRGAIRLAEMAAAAMRSGAGVVMVAAPRKICDEIAPMILESTLYPLSDNDGELICNEDELSALIGRTRVIAFGMGIGTGEDAAKALEFLISNFKGILIIDADGLNCLAKMPENILHTAACRRIVLTPHIKEFSRLTGLQTDAIKENPIGLAKEYAKRTGSILLLKGPSTVVTDGSKILITDRGCAGMATAGSGDVLSGITAAVCGHEKYVRSTDDLTLTVAAAAYINGLAGELAADEYTEVSMVAGDTVSCIPKAVKSILR